MPDNSITAAVQGRYARLIGRSSGAAAHHQRRAERDNMPNSPRVSKRCRAPDEPAQTVPNDADALAAPQEAFFCQFAKLVHHLGRPAGITFQARS